MNAEPSISELVARMEERDRFYCDRIDALAARIEQRFDAEQRAVENARREVDYRLEGMNEFRAQITNERGTFIQREVFDTRVMQTDAKLLEQERVIQNLQGRMALMYIVASAIVVALIAEIVRSLW